jgi:hypothetical protein
MPWRAALVVIVLAGCLFSTGMPGTRSSLRAQTSDSGNAARRRSGKANVQEPAADREQQGAACVQQTNEVLAIFDTNEGCELKGAALDDVASRYAKVRIEVCGEARSSYTDPAMNRYQVGLSRNQKCGSRQAAVATAGLQTLVASAAVLGIQESEISRAILEGRFVPGFDDLRLLARDLGPTTRANALEWNRRFGSLADLGPIRTVQDRAWVTRTGMDLVYRMFMDTRAGDDLTKNQRLDIQREDTYAKAVAYLDGRGYPKAYFDGDLAKMPASVPDYFASADIATGQYPRLLDYGTLRQTAFEAVTARGRGTGAPRSAQSFFSRESFVVRAGTLVITSWADEMQAVYSGQFADLRQGAIEPRQGFRTLFELFAVALVDHCSSTTTDWGTAAGRHVSPGPDVVHTLYPSGATYMEKGAPAIDYPPFRIDARLAEKFTEYARSSDFRAEPVPAKVFGTLPPHAKATFSVLERPQLSIEALFARNDCGGPVLVHLSENFIRASNHQAGLPPTR